MANGYRKCKNCAYYDEWGEYQGYCRRYPPKQEIPERQIIREIDGEVRLATSELFVIVNNFDFCGEYKSNLK